MEPDVLLTGVFRLSPAQKSALQKLHVYTLRDLLYHFPSRYQELLPARTISSVRAGERVSLSGELRRLSLSKARIKKITLAEGMLADTTGSIKLVWFNQPYLAKMLVEGSTVRVTGTVQKRKEELYISNPDVERLAGEETPESLFGGHAELFALPVYPESRGITSRWFLYAIQKLMEAGVAKQLVDPIPQGLLEQYHLPALAQALHWIHKPKKESFAQAARKRFAFEEVFYIQLGKQRERRALASERAAAIAPPAHLLKDFVARFPFSPTRGQKDAIAAIMSDLSETSPMSRLLEGDVGSGKTAVAAATTYATINTRPSGQDFGTLQVAYMAPTEILAAQHFETFIQYFRHLPVNIALITGSGCRKFPSKVHPSGWTDISRAQLLKWVASGEIAVLVGTHTLIQKAVHFKHLAYVIIDEQHRFGVRQRRELVQKDGPTPHLLSMTATPIPRTLALTLYGDLDLTVLDEMPAGRKQVITELVGENRKKMYEHMRSELSAGRQVYIICPRIDEPDPTKELALEAKSAKAEAARLKQEIFPEYEIGVLHSKLKPADKDTVMKKFTDGDINILVSTSVVEVGVNVPNATVIAIEGAERFGLAQLHQLRGRVLRSTHQAYCYLLTDSGSGKSNERLKAITKAKNGFELAEMDLKLRGPGALSGTKQWGISDIGMEALKNLKMVEAARLCAARLIAQDPKLTGYPALQEAVAARTQSIHWE